MSVTHKARPNLFPWRPTHPIVGVKFHCTRCETETTALACDDGTIIKATCKCGTFTWTVPQAAAAIADK